MPTVTAQPQRPIYVSSLPQHNCNHDTGIFVIIFAVASFCFLFTCGCWLGLPCAIFGIILGITVSINVNMVPSCTLYNYFYM